MAAKKYPQINFSVASAERLPYQDQSFDFALCIFAPYKAEEVLRILKPGGLFIVVGPGEGHMQQLANIVYQDFKPHSMQPIINDELQLLAQKQVSYQIDPSATELVNVWKMSPYYWHSREGAEAKIQELKALNLDFHIDIYISKPDPI